MAGTVSGAELPHQRKARYVELGVDPHSAGALSAADLFLRELFEGTVAAGAAPKAAANWITGEVVAWMRREDVETLDVDAAEIAAMIAMIDANELSTSAAKEVLDGILQGEGGARHVAESRDLLQMTDTGAIESAVDAVLAENPDAVERYRGGEQKVVGFLVGQVMRATSTTRLSPSPKCRIGPVMGCFWTSRPDRISTSPPRASCGTRCMRSLPISRRTSTTRIAR